MNTREKFEALFPKRSAVTVYPNGLRVVRCFDDSRLARCCKAGCWLHLAYAVARARGENVVRETQSRFDISRFWRSCRLGPPVSYADADTWVLWGAKRLEETEGYRPWVGRTPTPDVTSCALHVGFVGVPESEEQLARLRNETAPAATPAEARSKIFQTSQIPVPIDATAARVAPQE